MLMLISPAKSLDFDTPFSSDKLTKPEFSKEAAALVKVLREYSADELKSMMRISPALAELNQSRFLSWKKNPKEENCKAALPAFTGEVFRGINASSFSSEDYDFAQDHLRILSGLYGVLKPLDLIQPYRLEMGTKLEVGEHSNLYQFWGDSLNKKINALAGKEDVIINLASNEYFKAAKSRKLKARIITPVFKDYNKGKLKVVTVYAKNSRGQMVQYIVKNRITDPEKLKLFDVNGYEYHDGLSDENTWVFVRG
jgi:cytoplasmic iron level regulating protein YaaA (DUF328/UPF0246 family)